MNATHTYSNPGTYFPALIVTSAHCIDTLIQTIVIDTIPVAGFDHSFACGLTRSFTDSSIDADYYNWNFGDGNFSLVQNPTHTYLSPGN